MADAKDRLDAVQAVLEPFLKRRGFRRSGRTFRRAEEEGVVQVINLQAGMFPVSASSPSIVPPLYGRFTVNLGIAVAELYELQMGKPFKPSVQEHECAIRARLGHVAGELDDLWWDLTGEPEAVAHEVIGLLVDHGLPLLERFGTRAGILDGWVTYNESERNLNHVPRYTVALLRLARGEREQARALLQEQYRRASHDQLRAWLDRAAVRHGLGSLEA